MLNEKPYTVILEQAHLYKQIGMTRFHLFEYEDMRPWDYVTRVEVGGTHRFYGPVSLDFTAEVDGLVFSWSVEIEPIGSNGNATHRIREIYLDDIISKLKPKVRRKVASVLRNDILPAMLKLEGEIRSTLNLQLRATDAMRNLIEKAEDNEISSFDKD